jgi:hypothetical protein
MIMSRHLRKIINKYAVIDAKPTYNNEEGD